ncbi:hypothetical protein QYE76_003685 [Lolium multiflorum]|uniref:Uncharacterized protein n=1 Tax=Lolium multiflorum TaxID=4521 RepID=A0AAD8VZ24_LOLMU|nr:hypothetical protein QYE76_003685 [Lolium multiflorum]
MARLVNCHSADKAESSHSRGKDKEEAVPRDRPQDDDRRYLTEEEVRSIRYQRPLSVHLLNKYEQQYDRRRRYDEDDEKYRRSDAENRRYRQHDRNNDGYERHARGRSREQDNVDKHWNCPFFKHCWDSGMSRLPTIENCPECKQQRRRTNEVSVFERLGPLPPHNKRAESSQEEDFEESDGEEDRYHRPRWCPDGLSHSQKRRVQRLRNLEEAEAQYLYTLRRARPDLAVKIQQTLETKARPPKKVWRPKQAKADAQASADADAETSAEMPGLDRASLSTALPKKGFRPFQQRARQMKAEVLEEVKKEIKKMLDAGFIRPCRYAEWISNVVPVEKKDGRWRVAIDFRNLNSATPKDEYPMPVAETRSMQLLVIKY